MLKPAHLPAADRSSFWSTPQFNASLKSKADIVILMLGLSDYIYIYCVPVPSAGPIISVFPCPALDTGKRYNRYINARFVSSFALGLLRMVKRRLIHVLY
eukprot:SAG31_NODE_4629_length_3085_cov_2.778299_2_plen_100_part_00